MFEFTELKNAIAGIPDADCQLRFEEASLTDAVEPV